MTAIPIRSVRRGLQSAGWVPPAPARRYRVRADCDVPIELSDGTVLCGDIYRPRTDEPRPALLGWSPYQKDLMPTGLPAPFNEPGDVRSLAERGYAVAVVNARGTGRSAGDLQAMLGPAEVDDVCEVIGWLTERPWCNGRLGMIGMSYFAISQLLAAERRPPALAAIAPFGAATDLYRMVLTHNGAPHSGFLGRYAAINGATQRVRLHPEVRHALGYLLGTRAAQAVTRAAMGRLLPRLTRLARPPRPWLERWSELALAASSDQDGFRAASPSARLSEIDVPVLIGTEWSMVGLHLFGAFDAWHAVRAEKRLFVGPRWNRWPFQRFQEEILAWYDHFLDGEDNGVDALPPVRYWLHGAERWEATTDWPPPDSTVLRLFLAQTPAAGGGGLLGPAPPEGSPAWSWAAIPTGMEYPGAFDRLGHRSLRYRSAPAPAETHLAGPAHLTLRLSSSALDTCVQARLSVCPPDGGPAAVVSVGWLQAAHRAVDTAASTPTEIVHDHRAPAPLVPGEAVTLRFSLAPFAQLVPAGHHLLLELGSDPEVLAAPADQGYVYFPTAGPPYPARNTVHHGGPDPSRLELTVRGASPW